MKSSNKLTKTLFIFCLILSIKQKANAIIIIVPGANSQNDKWYTQEGEFYKQCKSSAENNEFAKTVEYVKYSDNEIATRNLTETVLSNIARIRQENSNEKIIVVTHDMGGITLRLASQNLPENSIYLAITFGCPNGPKQFHEPVYANMRSIKTLYNISVLNDFLQNSQESAETLEQHKKIFNRTLVGIPYQGFKLEISEQEDLKNIPENLRVGHINHYLMHSHTLIPLLFSLIQEQQWT